MSNINPQNIDGTFPIAGQDNNSQGFRDNFTNTINNFTFAAAELTDLQQNAVLKAALGSVGQSGTPTNDLNYAFLTHARIKGAVEVKATSTPDGSGAFTVSWESGHFQTVTITQNSTMSFGTWPADTYWTKLRLQVTVTSGPWTLTLPAAVSINSANIQGSNGASPAVITLATGTYVFEFTTYDAGATIAIEDVLRNYDAAIDFSSLNVTGNVLSTGLRVFGNASIGLAGAVSGQFHSVVGNITQTSSGGAVYINTTGNVLAAGATVNALTVNGDTTITGNVIRAGGQVDSGYQYYAPTGNTSITANVNVSRVILDPTADAYYIQFTLPAGNVDAKVVTLSTTANLSVVQPFGNMGTTVVPSVNVAMTKGTSIQFFYHATEGKWYKVA